MLLILRCVSTCLWLDSQLAPLKVTMHMVLGTLPCTNHDRLAKEDSAESGGLEKKRATVHEPDGPAVDLWT